jgi:hypothetical protein
MTDFSVKNINRIVKNSHSVYDTVDLMQRISWEFASAPLIMRLAKKLRGANKSDSCANIWHFIKSNIKYVRDSPSKEQVRTPVRTLQDEKGDCDCMSVLTSSLLHALNIPHKIRIVKVFKPTWEHVYIVALIEGEEYVIDCVPEIKQVFEEHPYTQKEDFMSEFAVLNAIAAPEEEMVEGLTSIDLQKIYFAANKTMASILATLRASGLRVNEHPGFAVLVKDQMILKNVMEGKKSLANGFNDTITLKPLFSALLGEGAETVNGAGEEVIEYVDMPQQALNNLAEIDRIGSYLEGLGKIKIGKGLKNAFKKIGNVAENVARATVPGAGTAIDAAKEIRDAVRKKPSTTTEVVQTDAKIPQAVAKAGSQEQPKTPTESNENTGTGMGFFQKAMDFLKKHWLKFAIAIVIIVAGIWAFKKKDKAKIQKMGLNGLEGVKFKEIAENQYLLTQTPKRSGKKKNSSSRSKPKTSLSGTRRRKRRTSSKGKSSKGKK